MIPVDVGWNDVGSWLAAHEVGQEDENENVILGEKSLVFDTKGSFIQSNDRLVAAIGLEDIVIVDTDDALLVCAKDKAQDVKKVVNWLTENKQTDLL